jgi:putative transposase
MVRPLRLEFAGALYHVMARGNRREALYLDDADFAQFLVTLGEVCERFNWLLHAYCLMTNHYHLLIETPDGNLSRGMRQLNGVYTQYFNRRHRKVGHLFQGRYKAVLVQKDAYLLELSRYVVLNPVRARMVELPQEWFWSSYRAALGLEESPPWLETDWLLAQFGQRREEALPAYVAFVAAGVQAKSPLEEVRHQLFLGDDAFIARFADAKRREELSEVSRAQRRPMARSLAAYAEAHSRRDQAMAQAYRSGGYTMKEIADYFGVHYMTVSRAVRKYEQTMLECEN